jgi:hypothetical protein
MEPPTHKVLLNVLLEKVVDKRRQVELVGKCCVQPLAVGLHVRPDVNGPSTVMEGKRRWTKPSSVLAPIEAFRILASPMKSRNEGWQSLQACRTNT